MCDYRLEKATMSNLMHPSLRMRVGFLALEIFTPQENDRMRPAAEDGRR